MLKFLSFLGIGPYLPSIYYLGVHKSEGTHFIQKAILDVLEQEGRMVDEAYIFVTDEAKKRMGTIYRWNSNHYVKRFLCLHIILSKSRLLLIRMICGVCLKLSRTHYRNMMR